MDFAQLMAGTLKVASTPLNLLAPPGCRMVST